MKFENLTLYEKKAINRKWSLPTNISGVRVDENSVPFILIGTSKVICGVKISSTFDNGFHSGSTR